MKALDTLVHQHMVEYRNRMRYEYAIGINAAVRAFQKEASALAFLMDIFSYDLIRTKKLYDHILDGECVSTFF